MNMRKGHKQRDAFIIKWVQIRKWEIIENKERRFIIIADGVRYEGMWWNY